MSVVGPPLLTPVSITMATGGRMQAACCKLGEVSAVCDSGHAWRFSAHPLVWP